MKVVTPFLKIFTVLIFVGTVYSCKKDSTRWETEWVLPFATDTLSLYNLHNDSTLDNFSSSNYLVDLERELLDVSLSDFFFIPDTTISQTFSPTLGIGSVPAGFTFYNEVEAHELSIPDAQLKKIIVSEGKIDLTVYNPIATGAYYTIQMPGAIKDGATLEYTFFINAGSTNDPAVANEEISLEGYTIDLRGEDISGSVNISGYNTLQTALSIMSDPSGQAVGISTSDIFEVEAKIQNLSIAYAQGFFGEQVFSDTSFFEIPALHQIVSGNIELEEVPVNIEISNGTKIPFSTKITVLENTNYIPETVSLNSSLIGSQQLISPATGTWSTLTPSNQLVTFSNANSNMTSYLENLGHTHKLGFEVRMNPFGSNTGSYNEIFPNSRLKLKLKSEFPLSIQSNGLTISDTIAASFSAQIVDDLVAANEVILDVSVVNAFPISGSFTVEFIDFNGQVIHEINNIGNIQSSLLGVMDTEENLMEMESSIQVVVGNEILSDLNLVNRIVMKVELNTETGVIQSIPSNAYLFFNSFLKVKTMNSTP